MDALKYSLLVRFLHFAQPLTISGYPLMSPLSKMATSVLFILFVMPAVTIANGFDWSSTEIQYLHGQGYRMPGNSQDIGQSIITVSHADGWALGRNFYFMDTLITDNGQPSQTSVYGEAYSYFSVNKLIRQDLSWGVFKDLNASIGVNAGENLDSPKSGTRIILYGFTIDFKVPGFKLLSLDILQHNVLDPIEQGPSWQFTPVWKLPFTIAGSHWSFEGFCDFIGSKNYGYVSNILAQPQIRLDVGDLFGETGRVFLGIEYQYWHNKFGIKGFEESLPQALLVWKFD